MIVAITGATGFIGQSLVKKLRQRDWTIRLIDRSDLNSAGFDQIDSKIRGCQVVINLAGASVSKKWSPEYKSEIRSSRIDTTRKIVESIRRVDDKPQLFISASAIGIYASEGTHDETSNAFSSSFLAKVCQEWEEEARQTEKVIRLVIFRIGVVLGKNGGALEKMERPFRMGLGGKLGSGDQPFSFIHIHDLVNAFLFAIENKDINGVVNAVSPHPSTNWEFTNKLGKVFGQPAFLTIPGFILKLALGEGAQIVLEGQRVLPDKLLKAGFRFNFPSIQNCLLDIFN
jgi:uncharacterized protein (TIGR01777 family)